MRTSPYTYHYIITKLCSIENIPLSRRGLLGVVGWHTVKLYRINVYRTSQLSLGRASGRVPDTPGIVLEVQSPFRYRIKYLSENSFFFTCY